VISNTSCLSVWQNAFVCGTWLLHMCDSGLPVWHDAFICATEFLRAWFQIVCTSEKLYMPSITMHVSNVVTRFHPLCYQSWHTRQIWSIPEILHLPNDIMYMSNIVIYMSNNCNKYQYVYIIHCNMIVSIKSIKLYSQKFIHSRNTICTKYYHIYLQYWNFIISIMLSIRLLPPHCLVYKSCWYI